MKYRTRGRTFKVYITVDTSGEYPRVVKDATDEDLRKNKNLKIEWAEFFRWDWESMNQIIKEATIVDPVSGQRNVDFQKLRELKLRRLLKDWSLEEDGKKIEIKRDSNGLTEQSWKDVTSVDIHVLNAFLNKADLVLEFGAEEEKNFTKPSPQPSPQAETESSMTQKSTN